MIIDYNEAFATWHATAFPSDACPVLPQKQEDLPIHKRMALANENPILFQNLFRGGALPADVQTRLTNNQLIPKDAKALRDAGYEHYAQECEKLGERVKDAQLKHQAEESQKEFRASMKKAQQWNNASFAERLAASPPTPQSIRQAREQWGITE